MATPTIENYLERIYELTRKTGFTRPTDIARALEVSQPCVTQMAKRLKDEGFVEYERYRDIALTQKGERLGKDVQVRHQKLTGFLSMIGVEDQKRIWRDVEGIEHHVSPVTMKGIRGLVQFFADRPEARRMLAAHRRGR